MPNILNGELGLSVRNKLNNTGLTKNNFAASSNPSTSDDSASGYEVGSKWINTSSDEEFVCLDATGSAAVWKSTTVDSVGSGSGLDSSQVISLLQPNIDSNETFFKAADASLQSQIDSNETLSKSTDASLQSQIEGSNIASLLDSHLGDTLWRDSDTVQSDISLVSNSTKVNNIVIMDSADYVALGSYDSNTIYFLT